MNRQPAIGNIRIEDYDYPLPEERIAKYPLPERDASKLLMLKNNNITQNSFRSISAHLPTGSLLVFNETRVIQARLLFSKETGARIEIFCLQPLWPQTDFQLAFQQKQKVRWKCLVGNSKRWKSGKLKMNIPHKGPDILLEAERKSRTDEGSEIEFSWTGGLSFGEILELTGHTPIPPYLKRESEDSDKSRYQTVYARQEGSVAAPTAGLHFTERVFNDLKKKGIEDARLSLHVGAGTFKPVVASDVREHVMHYERVAVKRSTLERIIAFLPDKVIAVGTTSVRTLESLYWHALKVMNQNAPLNEIHIRQWDPYDHRSKLPLAKEVLSMLLDKMKRQKLEYLQGSTQLMILPGYDYKIVKGMVTNFHQPKSTLLLLVSAFIGPRWKEVYQFALEHDFRFLSYGDSCLFLNII